MIAATAALAAILTVAQIAATAHLARTLGVHQVADLVTVPTLRTSPTPPLMSDQEWAGLLCR